MSEIDPSLTTQVAAQLLQVHESSVKRWCNAETLACWYTTGGHRRITLSALLDFARAQSLPCQLLDLQPYEQQVWKGVREIGSAQSYETLISLMYTWLYEGRSELSGVLIRFLLSLGYSLSVLFDGLVSPVLCHIGDGWQEGTLAVGDEHRMTESVRDNLYAMLGEFEQQSVNGGHHKSIAIVGCGRTESHDLGALMVRLLLLAQGWKVVYLGRRVPTEDMAFQQQRHSAALVCVSFAPPQDVPDAVSLVRTLSHLYDPQKPYRLALGGSGVRGGVGMSEETGPFTDLQCFEDTEAFIQWIDAFTHDR